MNNEIEELDLEPVRAWLRKSITDEQFIEILLEPTNIDTTLNLYTREKQWKKKL